MLKAKLFQNSQRQTVQLPKEIRFKGQEVYMHWMGSAAVLLPIDKPWQPLIDSLREFSEDFMDSRFKNLED